MKIRTQKRVEERAGVAMISTVITIFATAAMVGVMLTLATSTNKMSGVQRSESEARYLAEGALEVVKKSITEDLANWSIPSTTYPVVVDGTTVNVGVQPSGYAAAIAESSGIQTWHLGYVMRATAAAGDSIETVNELITVEATPIFQFAVFYTSDLEVHPGPDMTLGGRVHSNRDLYLATGGSTLAIDSNYMNSVGSVYRHRKFHPSKSGGNIQVRQWVENPYDPAEPVSFVEMQSAADMAANGVISATGYDSNFTTGYDANGDGDYDDIGEYLPFVDGALEYWSQPSGYAGGTGSTVQTGEHGVSEAVTPVIQSIQKYEPTESGSGGNWDYDSVNDLYVPSAVAGMGAYDKAFFHSQAGVTIQVLIGGGWKAYAPDGTDLTAAYSGAVTVDSLYDARQGGYVNVAELDVSKINNASLWPANDLIYACSEQIGGGTDVGGVVLKNGSELFDKLTVVSEGELYIQGDYNTVDKKGASVIADAVNLLSNSWDNSKSAGVLPSASDTSYNVALITGNQDSVSGGYNGGLENLPRFHEKWSGKDCNILGSFVNTWRSEYADGAWGKSGVYSPPRRNWGYDPDFNNLANLPPFTPMAVKSEGVVRW